MIRRSAFLATAALVFAGCQSYDFVFQPDADRLGRHLRFEVQTPSKADILFVVDNSGSMAEEQVALKDSFRFLLDTLAVKDTSYRLALVSSDTRGVDRDCSGAQNPPESASFPTRLGARGNCDRLDVELRRPHDGALGRALAAYDPTIFNIANPIYAALPTTVRTALAALFPTSATDGPVYSNGLRGVPWIIDREVIRADACEACACTACEKGDSCYDSCATPTAAAFVEAVFSSNVSGLGTKGIGWEEGIRAALLASGIDPEEPNGNELDPANNLTAAGRPNSHVTLNLAGVPTEVPWVREEALLAVMFVTDEQDCSMPRALWDVKDAFEEASGEPAGSVCYQEATQFSLLPPQSMANLFIQKKAGSRGRVAVGLIGGAKKVGPAGAEGRAGEATDCVAANAPIPPTDCSCLEGTTDDRWCKYSTNQVGSTGGVPGCSAFAASRYVELANVFSRKTFESVCRAEPGTAFGQALVDFANIATDACFDLGDEVQPARGSDGNIVVKRAPGDATTDTPPVDVPQVDPSVPTSQVGWYYSADENRICLTGRDRLIGDVYDIFVLTTDRVQSTR